MLEAIFKNEIRPMPFPPIFSLWFVATSRKASIFFWVNPSPLFSMIILLKFPRFDVTHQEFLCIHIENKH